MAKSYEEWLAERAPITPEEHRYRRERAALGPEPLTMDEHRARREHENIQRLHAAEVSNGRPDPNYVPAYWPVSFPLPIDGPEDPLGTPRSEPGVTLEDIKRFKDMSAAEQLEVIGRWAGFQPDPTDDNPMGDYV